MIPPIYIPHISGLPVPEGVLCQLLITPKGLVIDYEGNKYFLAFNSITDMCIKAETDLSSVDDYGSLSSIANRRMTDSEDRFTKRNYLIITYTKQESLEFISFDCSKCLYANEIIQAYKNRPIEKVAVNLSDPHHSAQSGPTGGYNYNNVSLRTQAVVQKKPLRASVITMIILVSVFVPLIIIGIIIGISTNSLNNVDSTVNSNVASSVSGSVSKNSDDIIYDNGEMASIGDWNITVNNIEIAEKWYYTDSEYSPYMQSDSGNVYYAVNMTVKNNGKELQTFLPYVAVGKQISSVLVYDNEYEYSCTMTMGAQNCLDNTTLNPLTEVTGTVLFSVPKNLDLDKDFVLEIKEGQQKILFSIKQ